MASENDVFDFKTSALSAVNFIIVYSEKDLEKRNDECVFKPEMSHQIFGENEIIFGYKNLTIDLYYLHNSSKCCLDIKFTEKVKDFTPDNLKELLNPWLPSEYTEDLNEFKKTLQLEKHDQIFGQIIHKFVKENQINHFGAEESLKCTYKISICDRNDSLFQEYHQRFETLIIWFIDAANFLDLNDERWMFFYIYEEIERATGEIVATPIGFSSIYKFFSYPNSNRARISQFFILPTHQKRGLGSEFYKTIHEHIMKMDDIVDITVEEPNESFQKMRDICDTLYIYKDLKQNNENIAVKSQKLLNKYMAKHKICKKQALRISDILQYYAAVRNGEEAEKLFADSLLKRMLREKERESKTSKKARGLCPEEVLTDPMVITENVTSVFSTYMQEIKEVVGKLSVKLSNNNKTQ